MNPTLKKIFIVVLIIGAVTAVAILVLGKDDTNNDLLQNSTVITTQSNEPSESSKFLQSLSQVKSINLDTTFFNNSSYKKLVDISIPIILEDQRLIGRPNPFAPIGVDAVFNQPESGSTETDIAKPETEPIKTDSKTNPNVKKQ